MDPLSPEYPWYTPYQFAGNGPIANTDLDGLEPIESITSKDNGALYIANVKSDWITVSATRALPGQLHGSDPISRNARTNPHTDVIGGLSSNVPTSGLNGYAGGVANSALAPIAAVGGAVLFAGAATATSLRSLTAFGNTARTAFSSKASAVKGYLGANLAKGGGVRFAVDFGLQASMNSIQGKSILGNYNLTAGLVSLFSPVGRMNAIKPQVYAGTVGGGLAGGFGYTTNDLFTGNTPSFSVGGAFLGGVFGGGFSGAGAAWGKIPFLPPGKTFDAFGAKFTTHPLSKVGEVGLEGLSASFGTVAGLIEQRINQEKIDKSNEDK